jgi:hypothetical protein
MKARQLDYTKLRHTTALALVGWYLMTPPLDVGGLPDDHAPISSWRNEQSFDSAQDCEQGKVTVLENRIEGLKQLEKMQTSPALNCSSRIFDGRAGFLQRQSA